MALSTYKLASRTLMHSRSAMRRWVTSHSTGLNQKSARTSPFANTLLKPTNNVRRTMSTIAVKKTTWWTDPEVWGVITAVSGWTMSLAAIYDSLQDGPEVISLNMTGVLIVYSSLFLRWAFIVTPRNLLLASCHFANICAQLNQLRRALQYKWDNGKEDEVKQMAQKAGTIGGIGALAIVGGPQLRSSLINANLGPISKFASSPAGPFSTHFWAPTSKWLISGASLADWNRPVESISLPQYLALTSCGILHARYALLVIPTNYMLCSVNLALFVSSAWHLGRKVKADYIDKEEVEEAVTDEEIKGPAQIPTVLIKKRSSNWNVDGVPKDERHTL